jgi:hypothetical protein
MRFYSFIPNQTFIFGGTKRVGQFLGGVLDTEDASEIEELNAILGKQATIYTKDAPATPMPEVAQNAASEQEITQQQNALAGLKVVTSVDTSNAPDTTLATQMRSAEFDADVNADQANAELKARMAALNTAAAK